MEEFFRLSSVLPTVEFFIVEKLLPNYKMVRRNRGEGWDLTWLHLLHFLFEHATDLWVEL
jgi:hypothetical protein